MSTTRPRTGPEGPRADALEVPSKRHLPTRAKILAALLTALLTSVAVTVGSATAKQVRPSIEDARVVQGKSSCLRAQTLALKRNTGARRLLRRKTARATASRACGATTPTAEHPMYWGAWIGSQLTGEAAPWDMSAVSTFSGLAGGKGLSLINFSSPFADCTASPCKFFRFPRPEMEQIRSYGAIPVFSWGSDAFPVQLEEPEFQLADVIEGKFDSYIREFAEEAKAWGQPFFLRFDWEMNAEWFEWAEGVNGNTAGQFVTAWRHVHDIFTSVGANNVSWVWCPYVDPGHNLRSLAPLYPGDEYVDWTGLDGYNWGTNPASPKGWRTFDQLFSASYDEITETIAPGKPLMISEFGSSEDGGSKAAWIEEALHSASTNYPDLGGLIWFDNYADGMDWPIETSATATQAFANGISAPAFQANFFGQLGGEKVAAPA